MDIVKIAPQPTIILAEETGKGATHRERFPQRLERYGAAKAASTAMADYIKQEQPDHTKLLTSLAECGNWLLFRDYYTADQIRLASASFCRKHLLCQFCAIRRGAKLVEQKMKQVNQVLSENPHLEMHMMTLTVKDGPDLKERFNHLTSNVSAFMKKRHKQRGSQAENIMGAVFSFEVKRGSGSGFWHPHAHSVILVDPSNRVNQAQLSKEWHDQTGDSFIVDVRPIKCGNEDDKAKAFCEVFKYALKFSSQPAVDTWNCYSTLNKRRFVTSYGLLYGVKEPLTLADCLLDELPYIEYFYVHFRNSGYALKPSPRQRENLLA